MQPPAPGPPEEQEQQQGQQAQQEQQAHQPADHPPSSPSSPSGGGSEHEMPSGDDDGGGGAPAGEGDDQHEDEDVEEEEDEYDSGFEEDLDTEFFQDYDSEWDVWPRDCDTPPNRYDGDTDTDSHMDWGRHKGEGRPSLYAAVHARDLDGALAFYRKWTEQQQQQKKKSKGEEKEEGATAAATTTAAAAKPGSPPPLRPPPLAKPHEPYSKHRSTPFMLAAKTGKPKMLEAIATMSPSPSIDETNETSGLTALELALRGGGGTPPPSALLKLGANPNASMGAEYGEGGTVLHAALGVSELSAHNLQRRKGPRRERVLDDAFQRLLLCDAPEGSSPDLNATDHLGRTPLMIALSMGRARAARLLLEKGAEASVVDADGDSALTHLLSGVRPASYCKSVHEAVQELLSKGAPAHAPPAIPSPADHLLAARHLDVYAGTVHSSDWPSDADFRRALATLLKAGASIHPSVAHAGRSSPR